METRGRGDGTTSEVRGTLRPWAGNDRLRPGSLSLDAGNNDEGDLPRDDYDAIPNLVTTGELLPDRDLGRRAAGTQRGALVGGNDLGQVVGQSDCMHQAGCLLGQPIFWQEGVFRNLNDFRPPGMTANMSIGRDANNQGVLWATSAPGGWFLTPMGVPDGDVNTGCRVDVADSSW